MNMHLQLFVLERCSNKFSWQIYSNGKSLKSGVCKRYSQEHFAVLLPSVFSLCK